MKKLLIASSALVAAAGSAAALDLSLNGEIEISADFDLANSGFDGADWEAGFTMKASGESMGWTYGGTIEFGMYEAIAIDDDSALAGSVLAGTGIVPVLLPGLGTNSMALEISSASAYMGGDFMGRIAVQDSCGNFVDAIEDAVGFDAADEVGSIGGHCVNWTGLSLGGLELKAAIGLDDDALIIGGEYLNPNLGKFSAEYDVMSENWDAEIGTIVSGNTIAIGLDYNATEEDYDYVVSAKGTFGDFSYGIAYSPSYLLGNDNPDRAGTAEDSVNGYGGYFPDTALPGARSGDAFKVVGVNLGYDCFSAAMGLDISHGVDRVYELARDGGTIAAANGTSAFLAGLGIGEAQNINANAVEQGMLAEWEVAADCELHDGVNITASLGAESARSVALQQLSYVQSQGEVLGGAFTTLGNLDRNAAIEGSVGMSITF